MGKRDYVVGIDIGSSQVVVAVGVREKEGSVTVLGVEKQKLERCVVNGEIKNYIPVANAIKRAKEELEAELNIQLRSAYVGISGSSTYCVRYEDYVDLSGDVRENDVRDLHSRIDMVAPAVGDTIVDRLLLEYTVDNVKGVKDLVGTFGHKLYATYLFVLTSREQSSRVRQVMDYAGIQIAGLCVNPTLLPDAILTKEEKSSGVVIVDIGGDLTDIMYVRDDKLNYFSSLPIGSSSIDADLVNFLPTLKSDITNVKHKYAQAIAEEVPEQVSVAVQLSGRGPKKQILKRNLAEITDARLMDIASYVLSELRVMKATKAPFGVVLTGGASYLANIDQLFARELGMPVRVAEDLNGINCEKHVSPLSDAVAAGLLLYGTKHSACDVVENRPMPTSAQEPTPTPAPIPTPSVQQPIPKPVPTPAVVEEVNTPDVEDANDDADAPKNVDVHEVETTSESGDEQNTVLESDSADNDGSDNGADTDTDTDDDDNGNNGNNGNDVDGGSGAENGDNNGSRRRNRLGAFFNDIRTRAKDAYDKIDQFFAPDEEI